MDKKPNDNRHRFKLQQFSRLQTKFQVRFRVPISIGKPGNIGLEEFHFLARMGCYCKMMSSVLSNLKSHIINHPKVINVNQ